MPDPQAPATFERSRLDWSEREKAEHAELLAWYRDLIGLRRSTGSVLDGRFERLAVDYCEADGWLIVQRGALVTVCNLADRRQTIPLCLPRGHGHSSGVRAACRTDGERRRTGCG